MKGLKSNSETKKRRLENPLLQQVFLIKMEASFVTIRVVALQKITNKNNNISDS